MIAFKRIFGNLMNHQSTQIYFAFIDDFEIDFISSISVLQDKG